METATTVRCPSWDKVSAMLGEWNRHTNHAGPMTPERAQDIAAAFYAVFMAKRQGWKMPKDWERVHPSLPYQLGAWHDRILQSDTYRAANHIKHYDFEARH